MFKHKIHIYIPVLFWAGIFFCCENSMEKVNSFAEGENLPTESLDSLNLILSDSGQVKIQLKAVLVDKFYQPKEKTVIRNGMTINFFNPDGSLESRLTADKGEIIPDEKYMRARNNVVFYNYTEQQSLITEELEWLQDEKKLNTDKEVQVKTKKATIFGQGLQADETFSWFKMKHVTAEIKVGSDSTSQATDTTQTENGEVQ